MANALLWIAGSLVVLFIFSGIFGNRPAAREGVSDNTRVEFAAKCDQMISDSVPGEERRTMRELCDAAKARLGR